MEIKLKKPDFKKEWRDALRFREFESMGFDAWVKLAKNNYNIVNYSDIKNNLSNINLDFEKLQDEKKDNFFKNLNKGEMEMPIAVKFSNNDIRLIGGNTRLAGFLSKSVNPKIWVIDFKKEEPKKDVDEVTCAASSGQFAAPMGGKPIKRPITTIHNSKSINEIKKNDLIKEILDSSISAGAQYDVPFGGGTKGRKNPLKIDGPKSIKKSRAVKDKNFPKFGGPGGVFIKIKDKCKKFPYCNQGDINAIEVLKESMDDVSKKYNIPVEKIKKIVLKEIKRIFIDKNER